MVAEDRGRHATTPSQIPLRGWLDIAKRLYHEISRDNLSIIAAGVAFYAMFALPPALAATVAVYGLVSTPAEIEQQLQSLAAVLPQEVIDIIRSQLMRISQETAKGGWIALSGVAIAIWSASKGIKSIMTALNIVYDEEEKRSFIRFNVVALVFTIGAIVMLSLSLALVAILPAVFNIIDIGGVIHWVISLLRWPILAAVIMLALAVLYRYGPSRDEPQWRWISWGSIAATCLWIVASIGFSWYVSAFGSYNKTYGSLAAVAILLFWAWLSAFVVLLGAELNAEMEHQTEHDTTDGQAVPMGRRGAVMADTVANEQT